MNPQRARVGSRLGWITFVVGLLVVQTVCGTDTEHVISLAGTWRFRLDPEGIGVQKRWFLERFEDSVVLPGTTDTNHKGIFKNERAVDRLSRVWYWKGPAWYQREVVIPESWRGKHITLFLERSKTTRVWVDDVDCGGEDTLSAPQVFDLTHVLTPGRHVITILVDNAKLPPVGPSHAVDERTQTNWNGIIGRIELRATDPVWMEDIQVYPDIAKTQAVVRITIGNLTGKPVKGQITIGCESYNVAQPHQWPKQSFPFQAVREQSQVNLTYKFRSPVPLWDEFQPALLRMHLQLEGSAGNIRFRDDRTVRFGMRHFGRVRNQFVINGRRVFLRGRTDSCIYPLTGYPPMDKAGWRRVFSILKSYGLNHCRFHSWCPPEAAFEAADELGMYLQVELPNKRSNFRIPSKTKTEPANGPRVHDPTKKTLYEYAKREGELILKAFGNHPSFVMFTLGNELGRNRGMYELVAHFKRLDNRHLYAQGSNNMHWAPSLAEGDDFWVTAKTAKDLPVRGSFFEGDYPYGHIEHRPPSTMVDYNDSISGVPVPVVAHEVGQYQVFPDFREIPHYTGVTRARNLEIFRQRLKQAGMLDLADDFVRASGALAVICYREDIEAALRTPYFGGFQLLDIQDFPGQGTALVGILNAFMESKGLITPEQWRQFCCETVPLLRMKRYTWTTDQIFAGLIQVAHYGPTDLVDAQIIWTVTGQDGHKFARGAFQPITIKQGSVTAVDMVAVPLWNVKAPQKLTITLTIRGTPYRNSYPIWVYPSNIDTNVPEGILVTRTLDASALQYLRNGGKVLLFPQLEKLKHCVKGAFQTDFWCWPMFARAAKRRGMEPPPGTLGILCDPNHPALARFPTEFHSNWQWWWIVKKSRPIILDDTPTEYRPIIQVIDNFARNHKLGLLFETRVGAGKLLVCASDLPALQDHPEARQLMHSLLQYMDSPLFAPKQELDVQLLKTLLNP